MKRNEKRIKERGRRKGKIWNRKEELHSKTEKKNGVQ